MPPQPTESLELFREITNRRVTTPLVDHSAVLCEKKKKTDLFVRESGLGCHQLVWVKK
jgi:hypothetical protein